MNSEQIYVKRYVARFIVEAETPLSIGTGKSGLNVDQLLQTDVNGLPYIPGTSLMGVLRGCITRTLKSGQELWDDLWGFQNNNEGKGARLIISNAYMIGVEGRVMEGICYDLNWNSSFYQNYKKLPVRQHVRITDKGGADICSNGKFDEQVVYKGTRFVFDVELKGNDCDSKFWDKVIATIKRPDFRIGSGVRKGFGKLKVIQFKKRCFDLRSNDLEDYLNYSGSFNESFSQKWVKVEESGHIDLNEYDHYQLLVNPDNFFFFGSGMGSSDVDMLPVKEKIVEWREEKPYFSEEYILIPATSVKGAIAHRVAYYYNLEKGIYSDRVQNPEDYTGENNDAVKLLFGCKKGEKGNYGERGKVIFSDLYKLLNERHYKLLDHVSLDRFTGGGIEGALFNEQVICMKDIHVEKSIQEKSEEKFEFTIDIYVEKSVQGEIKKTFELALQDIKKGYLQLGGGIMRGHGCFSGKLLCNGKEL